MCTTMANNNNNNRRHRRRSHRLLSQLFVVVGFYSAACIPGQGSLVVDERVVRGVGQRFAIFFGQAQDYGETLTHCRIRIFVVSSATAATFVHRRSEMCRCDIDCTATCDSNTQRRSLIGIESNHMHVAHWTFRFDSDTQWHTAHELRTNRAHTIVCSRR